MHTSAPQNVIATLHRGAYGKVEFLRCNGIGAAPARSEIATRLHFSLPIVGSFVWHAEHEDVFADPTVVLCTHVGEPYRISHPRGGDQTLVFIPSRHVASQLSERVERAGLGGRRRTLIAPARAQLLAYTFCVDPWTHRDAFAADESLLQFFESIVVGESTDRTTHDDALLRRTLEFVHDTPEPQLSLQSVAAAVGVRASYLTHAFARRTGQPLYRYIMSLKLSRALHRITATLDDLTRIALDLGFSSHSHLSAAFKARYGTSPSEARGRLGSEWTRPTQVDARPSIMWRPLCTARGGVPHAGSWSSIERAAAAGA
jgi:AraC family transcriptional regulator